jgi:hypothetical protein
MAYLNLLSWYLLRDEGNQEKHLDIHNMAKVQIQV